MIGVRSAMVALSVLALGADAAAQPRRPAPEAAVHAIVASPGFKSAMATFEREHDRTVADTITLTEIEAPPFKETRRAQAYMAMLKAHGLTDVEMDEVGNVMGLRRGTGPAGGKLVVIAAHLDTVFPEGTRVKVRREGTKLHAPGVGDDTYSLAVLLGYVRALDAARIRTQRDILFVGNVGEEGPGDLRGMRHFFGKGEYKDRVHAFFSMDGTEAARVTNGAVGSRRYRVTFKGPGGHSYGAFGIVNPMQAMAKAVVDFGAVQVPARPRTTYAASVVGGGTSVNSIPDAIWLEVDMRSESREELAKLDAKFLQIVKAAAEHENLQRSTRLGRVTADVKPIGDRPAGMTPETAEIVRATRAAVQAAGFTPQLGASSTDSNVPISLGVPAVTIGSGGNGARAHSVDEWIDVSRPEAVKGAAVGLASILAMAGVAR